MSAWDPGYGPLIDTTMRVATWNLWGRYGPWEDRLPIIEANLRTIDADIVCLQEAWDDETTSQPAQIVPLQAGVRQTTGDRGVKLGMKALCT